MSISTTSGWCLGIPASASSAVAQANTHEHSGSVCTKCIRLSRMVLLSSTMATRIIGSTQRHIKSHGGAAVGLAGNFKTSAHLLQPRSHVDQAVAATCAGVGRQTVSVVGNGQPQPVADQPYT